jgi:hypothetical protein
MSPRPRRVLRVLPIAVAAVVLGAACSPVGGQPTEYGSDYRKNFMIGCTGADPGETPTLASRSFCECFYEGLSERVPFDEAKEFEEAQAKADSGEDIEVPRNIQAIVEDCEGRTEAQPS